LNYTWLKLTFPSKLLKVLFCRLFLHYQNLPQIATTGSLFLPFSRQKSPEFEVVAPLEDQLKIPFEDLNIELKEPGIFRESDVFNFTEIDASHFHHFSS